MPKAIDMQDTIRRNPQVDADLLREHQQICLELKKLGRSVKSAYRLEPPLGGVLHPLRFSSRSKSK